jgi:hypothetical protein
MADQARQDDDAATARAAVINGALSIGVQLAMILAVRYWIDHQEQIAMRGRRLRALARRTGLPADLEFQVREFARAVSAYDHGDRS